MKDLDYADAAACPAVERTLDRLQGRVSSSPMVSMKPESRDHINVVQYSADQVSVIQVLQYKQEDYVVADHIMLSSSHKILDDKYKTV